MTGSGVVRDGAIHMQHDTFFTQEADESVFGASADGRIEPAAATFDPPEAAVLRALVEAAQVVIPEGEHVVHVKVTPGEVVELPFGPEAHLLARLGDGNLAIKVGDVVVILEGYADASNDPQHPVTLESSDGKPLDIAALLAATDPTLDIQTAAGPGGNGGGQGAENTGAILQQFGGGEGGLGGFEGAGAQGNSNGPNGGGAGGEGGPGTTGINNPPTTNTPVNVPPIAADLVAATDEDTKITGTLPGSDADGDPLTYSVVGALPKYVTVNPDGSWSFDPSTHYDQLDTGDHAAVTFQYKANDGAFDSNTGTVTIDVTGVNDPPRWASGTDAISFEENAVGEKRQFSFGIDDPDDTSFAITLQTPLPAGFTYDPTTFTVTGNPAGLYDFLKAGEEKDFTLTLDVSDGEASTTHDITLKILGINDAPTVGDAVVSVSEDGPAATFALTAVDLENQALTYQAVGALPAGVTLNGDGTFTFDPGTNYDYLAAGESTQVSFQYKANDGTDDSNIGTVSILVNGVNDAPTVSDMVVSASEDGPAANFFLSGADPEQQVLTYQVVGAPPAGVTLNGDGTFSFNPGGSYDYLAAGETTQVSFQYKANDGTADSNIGTVEIIVNGVNDAPTVGDAVVSVSEDGPAATFALPGVDPEQQVLTYQAVGALPAGVTLNNDGTFSFDPGGSYDYLTAGESTQVSFQYKANDGTDDSNIGTVSILINGAYDPPVPTPDVILTNNGTTPFDLPDWAVLANDKDADGRSLSIGAEQWSATDLSLDHTGGHLTIGDIAPLGAGFQYASYDGLTSVWTPVSVINQDGGDLHGTAAQEILVGSSANAKLDGGGGHDLIFGGSGNETFIFHDGDKVDGGSDSATGPTLAEELTTRGDVLVVGADLDLTDAAHDGAVKGIETISTTDGVGQTVVLDATAVQQISDHHLDPLEVLGDAAVVRFDGDALDQLYLSTARDGGDWVKVGSTANAHDLYAHEATPGDPATVTAYVVVSPTTVVHVNQDPPH